MHRRMFLSEVCYLTSQGAKRVQARKEADEQAIISSRSQMIEVCSESSFQPLLQLYLFLPTLLMFFSGTAGISLDTNQSVKDWFNNVSELQFWSILTSCISLSWSFNRYQSVKKNGALGFGVNPMGRILLLLSNILQVSSRLVAFILFAYSRGDGNFWPMFVIVLIHIAFMSLIHFYQINKNADANDRRKTPCLLTYQSILNGISNLYLRNLILPLPDREKNKDKDKNESFHHQLLVDIVFTLENVIIIFLAAFFVEDIPIELLMFVISSHLLGLLLKGTYYQKFHIWSSVLTCKNPCSHTDN